MTASGILSYDELLTLARKARAAAADGDHDRLMRSATHLVEHLREHFAAERDDLHRLAPRDERLLAHGQRRVADTALDLTLEAQRHNEPCQCETLAWDLIALLGEQATDERLAGMPMIGTAPTR